MAKKVFVSGCYDLLHSGHVEFFKQASQYGDLYVGIGSDATYLEDKHRKPMFPEEERLFMVRNIKARFGVEHAIFDMEITAIAIAVKLCYSLPVVAMKMISDVPEAGHTEQSYDEFAESHSDFSAFITALNQMW